MSKWVVGQVLYRAVVGGAWIYDTYHPDVRYIEYVVEKVTPEGGWLKQKGYWTKKKWRSFGTRFASETKEAALEHATIRTSRYVGHCRRRLREAEARLKMLSGDEPVRSKYTLLRKGEW